MLHAFTTNVTYLATIIEQASKSYTGLDLTFDKKQVSCNRNQFIKRLISSEISVFSAFKYNYKLLFAVIFTQQ